MQWGEQFPPGCPASVSEHLGAPWEDPAKCLGLERDQDGMTPPFTFPRSLCWGHHPACDRSVNTDCQPRYKSAIGNRRFKNNSTGFFFVSLSLFPPFLSARLIFRLGPWAHCRETPPWPHCENTGSGASKDPQAAGRWRRHTVALGQPGTRCSEAPRPRSQHQGVSLTALCCHTMVLGGRGWRFWVLCPHSRTTPKGAGTILPGFSS